MDLEAAKDHADSLFMHMDEVMTKNFIATNERLDRAIDAIAGLHGRVGNVETAVAQLQRDMTALRTDLGGKLDRILAHLGIQ